MSSTPKRKESLIHDLVEKTVTSFKRRYSEELEAQRLEKEIADDNYVPPPKRKIARVRRKGEHILHSKHILLIIVLLNLADCVLVLGELILDIHYVKEILETADVESQKFIDDMERKYPDHLQDNDIDHLETFFNKINEASCTWSDNDKYPQHLSNDEISKLTNPQNVSHDLRKRRADETKDGDHSANTTEEISPVKHKAAHAHSVWEDIAHGLHKASIAILAVLFVENILKIMFMGKRFFTRKLEVFDAFIVIVSFIVDLVFLKGLTEYRIQDGIFILSFLLPWRVIRVVNSLIVAVLDHEHFRLKMMYKKQKSVSSELRVVKESVAQFKFHLMKIERFCLSEGIPHWKVKQHIAFNERQQSTVSSMASYALGGILSGLGGKNLDSCLISKSMYTPIKDKTNFNVTDEKETRDNRDKISLTESGIGLDMSNNNSCDVSVDNDESNSGALTGDQTRTDCVEQTRDVGVNMDCDTDIEAQNNNDLNEIANSGNVEIYNESTYL